VAVGLLSDFFLATSDEVNSIDVALGPASQLPTVRAKGFDPVELVSLEARLRSIPDDAVHQPTLMDSGDTLVVALSVGFRDALAAMDRTYLSQFGEEWFLSDDEVAILGQVADLARRGKADGRDLYVWQSV
jgi:hypothetical protein